MVTVSHLRLTTFREMAFFLFLDNIGVKEHTSLEPTERSMIAGFPKFSILSR